jgi:hypothetical protein
MCEQRGPICVNREGQYVLTERANMCEKRGPISVNREDQYV